MKKPKPNEKRKTRKQKLKENPNGRVNSKYAKKYARRLKLSREIGAQIALPFPLLPEEST